MYDSSVRRCLTDLRLCDIVKLVDLLCDVAQAVIQVKVISTDVVCTRLLSAQSQELSRFDPGLCDTIYKGVHVYVVS